MHDIDRTQLESEQYEAMHDIGSTQLESAQQEAPSFEVSQESEGFFGETPLHEVHEMELASELLEVTNEEELEEFLNNVFRAVGSTIGRFARSDTGRALSGILRDAARQTLPVVGGAVGSLIAPGRGGPIGSQLAQQAGALLGLELEGLSPQDQEFESARQFVRFAGNAYANAAAAPPDVSPAAAAQRAAAGAAQTFAPGLTAGAQQREEELRGFRARPRYASGRRARPRRPYRRRFRPPPAYGYAWPIYGGWSWPPYEPQPYGEPGAEDQSGWGGEEPAGPGGEPSGEASISMELGSNGFAAGARNGRWVKRGHVLIVYGA
jgi:hypothetical protein